MKVHFIAIGGSAMHNLAIALKQKGYQVTGSDDSLFEPSKSRLEKYGILPPAIGWFPERITPDLDAVILGMHAHSDNPEMLRAQELGLKIYSYPEFLYEQSKDKTRVVIGGSHGKTTITSMILHALHYHGREEDYMVGAQLEGFEVMVRSTEESDFMIMEGDEYLSSALDRRSKFLLYQPNVALLSGIAWDHINVFPTFENYVEQFEKFVDSITNGGIIVYNAEDPNVVRVVLKSQNPIRKIPYKTPAHYIEDGITYLETAEGPIPLEIFGKHNLSNLEGARHICNHLGMMDEEFYEAIQSFTGASKRLELVKRSKDYVVYKDYAHSPSKVTSTTAAVKEQYPDKDLVACLELHTYSSLNPEFLAQYKDSLAKAEIKIVYYSEEALRIKRREPIEPAFIKEAFNDKSIEVFTEPEGLKNYIENLPKAGKVFLMMSSGNYGGLDLKEI
ncbi:UDP-N-acetylmuramate--L-alanine ligase [Ornithobacterium rhinotracheale]|uniref:UDP-N-acetylmuramate-alanine ligase n=1 Tax=Ornithobacterium rhinotracheale (strain ATCC 51463 / DSM 15997 / CCUG 23171 / CIP 104009 / LMG 9086) TaxID=867902 RepID=I4A028_ORNRL|nr:Mur ligase family protein [Ornithobacterium rhinotracheale]AFL97312.1 UDP-N-acetylmuramate-alanine ligase [Ornithobacterium rhinotracheale DSM 15997]AIP99361.1 peptidoglycan synthetase [Ornithobacterium rhinotracheale ORT-UMN 88]KGB67159.1 peptidoglycan synthetase [Ornithobacterium rhinotracheale H06-030791]MBN3663042.1 peptidoglycan synthetase [Ornithobacterium rhinotracheale]MCK0194203.1 Mur ligase family protein [Ornithobacterium rhinotracheale]